MRIAPIFCLLAFAACSNEALINAAYPDRARFSFLNADQDMVFYWACENGPTDAETEDRAKAAHRFMDAQITAVSEDSATRLLDGVGAGQSTIGASLDVSHSINAQMEVIVEQTEAQFQCMMYDNLEV